MQDIYLLEDAETSIEQLHKVLTKTTQWIFKQLSNDQKATFEQLVDTSWTTVENSTKRLEATQNEIWHNFSTTILT